MKRKVLIIISLCMILTMIPVVVSGVNSLVEAGAENKAAGSFSEKSEEIDQLIREAREQYLEEDYTRLSEPVKYRILWIGFTHVKYGDFDFQMTDFDKEYLEAAALNFEKSVEQIVDHNLDIEIDLHFVDTIKDLTMDSDEYWLYLNQETVQKYLNRMWPGWRITGRLGAGTYGAVFEIQRENLSTGRVGSALTSALKVLYIETETYEDDIDRDGSLTTSLLLQNDFPDMDSQARGRYNRTSRLLSDGMSQNSLSNSQREKPVYRPVSGSMITEFVNSVSSEINAMIELKGHPHIVSIEDYQVDMDDQSCLIMIRMEELRCLSKSIREGLQTFTREETIRLGIDICKALELSLYIVGKEQLLHGNLITLHHIASLVFADPDVVILKQELTSLGGQLIRLLVLEAFRVSILYPSLSNQEMPPIRHRPIEVILLVLCIEKENDVIHGNTCRS